MVIDCSIRIGDCSVQEYLNPIVTNMHQIGGEREGAEESGPPLHKYIYD